MSHFVLFFFNDTATTEIYTLSLHDALPIWAATWRTRSPACCGCSCRRSPPCGERPHRERSGSLVVERLTEPSVGDRKSTRLNSSHANISYAVFCLKKKKQMKDLR